MSATATTRRLGLGLKIGYGSGDLVAGLAFNTLNFYFLFFLNTVVGLPAYLAGLVLLVGRFYDGITDPLMGMIVDNTTARRGKHRFWMLAGILPFALTFFLLWIKYPGGQWAQFITYSVLFVLFCTAFTVYNIPYGSMTADLTQDYHERTALTGVRMVFSLLAMIIGAGVTPLLAGMGAGYAGMGAVFGAVMLAAGLGAYCSTAGRDTVACAPEGLHLRIWLQALRNRPFVLLVTSYLLLTAATAGVSAAFVYFVKYNLGLTADIQSSLIMGVLVISAIAALPLWAWASRAFSKKIALVAGMAVFGAGLLVITSVRLTLGNAVFYALAVLTGVGLSAFFIVLWSMIPDVVEYGQLQSGHRHEGVYYGLWFFVQKLGMAGSAALNGAILSITGFKQAAGGTILQQSSGALAGIASLLTWVPLTFIVAGLLLLVFYPIDAQRHSVILKRLQRLEARAARV